MEELLTVKECSVILKTSPDYVYRLIDNGLLKCLRIGRIKVRRSALDELIRSYEGYDITDPNEIKKMEE